MDNVITVRLSTKTDLREFMECVTKLSGSARAIQGSANVDARSALGIASIMESGDFSLRLVGCQPEEIDYFRKWSAEKI